MSVVTDVRISAEDFRLGRVLRLDGGASLELERAVPLGDRTARFVRVYDCDHETLADRVGDHGAVRALTRIETHDDHALYALDWADGGDALFRALDATAASLLSATGTADAWSLTIRFPSRSALAEFAETCSGAGIDVDVRRIYDASHPETGPWHGLTERQRETLLLAVRRGYYDIPRRTSMGELAAELEISDQAVSERLRRAIVALVRNTMPTEGED